MNPIPNPSASQLAVGQCGALACLLEATAPKPGNVHRGADFEDLTYTDLAISGIVIAPALDAAATGQRVGPTVLQAVTATRGAVGTNSNLGIILLLAPLAAVPRSELSTEGVARVLGELNAIDAQLVYESIRLAQPGGLGRVDRDDVHADAPPDLLTAMRAAADRDLVARQYTNDFEQVFHDVLPVLAVGIARGWPLLDVIVQAHLTLMSRFPDSLIARKCGLQIAQQASDWAAHVLQAGEPGSENYHESLADLDFWLRSDGHRRNPGTTADLITAGLFVALRTELIQPPFRV